MLSTARVAPSFARMPSSSSRAFGLELDIKAMASVAQLIGFSATLSPPAAATPKVGLTMRMVTPLQLVLAKAATTALAARWPSAMASDRYWRPAARTSPAAKIVGIEVRPSVSTTTCPVAPRASDSVGRLRRRRPDEGSVAGEPGQFLGLEGGPAIGAGDDDRESGVEGAVAGRAMREASSFELVLVGNAESALVEAGRDHDGTASVALALRGLHRPRAIPGNFDDFAEADLHAGDDGVVGQQRGHLGAAEDFVEVVEFAKIDQHAAGRELIQAQ